MKKRKILSSVLATAIAVLLVLSTFTAAGLTAEAKDAFGGIADFFGGAFADLREKLTDSNDYPDPVPKTQIGDSSTYWEYADGVLTISGEGAMPDGYLPWYHIREHITSVLICDGVTSVEVDAFEDCTSLASVTLPEGLTTIGDYAFAYCTSLASVTFPEGLTTIGDNAFTGTSLESVTFPEGLTTIGEGAFSSCAFLASVTLPEGLTTIENYMFSGCTSLNSIILPDGPTSIGEYSFAWCSSLASVSFPEGLTTIGEWAFFGCDSLERITLPASISLICYGSFYGCDSLLTVTLLSETPPTLEDDVFYGCDIWRIYVPEGKVETYKSEWNEYADQIYAIGTPEPEYDGKRIPGSLTFWKFEDGVLTISGEGDMPDFSSNYKPWFDIQDQIQSVIICKGVTTVGKYAFYGCTSLASVSFPKGLTKIGSYSFRGCSSLANVTFPEGLTTIGDNAFAYCSSLASVAFTEGLISIGEEAFCYCTSLESITLPKGLTTIGFLAFCYCTSLVNVAFPEGLMTTGEYTFCYCTSLESLALPEGLTTIGEWAFYFCTSLKSITCLAKNPPEMNDSFDDCSPDLKFYVPAESVEAYKEAWNEYADRIYPIEAPEPQRQRIGDSETYWEYADGVLTISGEGAMPNVLDSSTPWKDLRKDITSVVITKGVTSVGGWAFYNCSSLINVTLPEGLILIGSVAFGDCFSLESVTLPNGVKTIESGAFSGCYNLININLPEGLTSIKEGAFDVTSITSIILPKSLSSLERFNFSSLKNVSVTDGNETFHSAGNCVIETAAKTLVLGTSNTVIPSDGSVTSIGAYAFYNSSVKNMIFPEGLTTICDFSFSRTLLENVILPESLTTIGYYAFSYCDLLSDVTCLAKEPPEMEEAFVGSRNLKIYVPAESVEAYKEAWSNYADIIFPIPEPVEKTQIGDSSTYWEYADGVLTISGEGATPDFAAPNANLLLSANAIPQPWADLANNITEIVIGNGVTKLGENAFAGLSLVNTVTVESETPPTLPENAFADCSDSLEIHVPETAGDAYKEAWSDYAEQIVADEEPEHEHSYDSVVTPPTCTEQGYTTHTCSCGDSYVDTYVSPLGHSFTKYVSDGNATCTKDGTKTAKCDRCEATDTKTDTGSARGHDFVVDHVVEPTETEKGYTLYKCSRCDATEKRDWTDPVKPVYEKGDVNGDGEVTITDYLMIKAHVLGTKEFDAEIVARMNVNGDKDDKGKDVINIADYLLVKKFVLEK